VCSRLAVRVSLALRPHSLRRHEMERNVCPQRRMGICFRTLGRGRRSRSPVHSNGFVSACARAYCGIRIHLSSVCMWICVSVLLVGSRCNGPALPPLQLAVVSHCPGVPPLPRPPPVVSGPSMLVPGLRPRAHPVHGCPRRGLLALGRREGLCGPSLSRGPCVLLFSPPTPFRIHYTQRAAVFAVHHIFFKVTAPAPALAAPSPSASSLRLECSSQGAGRLVRVCCCTAGCFNQPRWGICFRSPGKAVQ